jgi:hypothetical protein
MFRNIISGLTVFVMLSASTVMGQVADKEKIAVAAAEKWLIMIDGGRYGESWKEAAGYFRTAVKQEQWEQTLQALRKPFGKLISRKLKSKSYTTSLPGAPDGEYVVIQFETSFENKKSAIETVTPVKDKDGKWRVSGYYINQPARQPQ